MKELKIVRNLLDQLDKITYCHWKSNQHFDQALIGVDDLDILVDRKQADELLKILAKLHFKHFYTPAARTYIGIEDWLGFDEETGKIIHLHLHYNLVVGEKHLKGFLLPIEKDVLENRIYDEKHKVYMSSREDELLLLLLRLGMKVRKRDLRKKKIIEKNTQNEFDWLKKNAKKFEEYVDSKDFLTPRIKAQLLAIYQDGVSWNNLNKLKKYLYKDLACYSQGTKFHNTAKRHWREFSRIKFEILKKFFPSQFAFLRRRSSIGGLTIAFLGADGSGKSSSIEEIYGWLKKVVDVRKFYLGSGDGKSSILRAPLRFAKKNLDKTNKSKKADNHVDADLSKTTNSISPTRKLWVYTLSKERIKKLITMNRCRQYGYTVLTDRFPQDEFDGLCDGPRLRGQKGFIARKEAKVFRLAKMCAPDIAIKLIASPEVAQSRKPNEIDPVVNKSLTDRILKIKLSKKTTIVVINADRKKEEVLLDIKRAIWKGL